MWTNYFILCEVEIQRADNEDIVQFSYFEPRIPTVLQYMYIALCKYILLP